MILFVGDVDDSVRNAALDYGARAFLVDRSNVEKILQAKENDLVVYTSFADLPKMTKTRNVFFEILDRADMIYYVPPKQWSDHNEEFDHWNLQRITEYLLYVIHRQKKNVIGLNLVPGLDSPYLKLADVRQTPGKQLWIAGCSIPHGDGVKKSQRFGNLLASKLELSVSHLTYGGSGIPWAADQILRSDIRPGDILTWAVTSEYRYCFWDKKMIHNGAYTFESSEDRRIGDGLENMVYRAVTSIHQVINFCHKIGVKLILLPTIPSETLRLAFHDCDDWHSPDYHYGFLDLGSDGVHPGSVQHAEWADFCYDIIMKDQS